LATAECDGRGGLEGEKVRTRRIGTLVVGEALPGEKNGAEVFLDSVGCVVRNEAAPAGTGEVVVGEVPE
jgi:hypothetical protein